MTPKFQVGDIIYLVDYDYDRGEYYVTDEIIETVCSHSFSSCIPTPKEITFYYSSQTVTHESSEKFYTCKVQAEALKDAYMENLELSKIISKLKRKEND